MPDDDAAWLLVEDCWTPARANYFETVFTVGNGRLGTRGSLEEGHRGSCSGHFLAGVYDDHDSPVIDLVNCPDWLQTVIEVDGVSLDVDTMTVAEHRRWLDLRAGVLFRDTVFEDSSGRRTRLQSARLASMTDRDLAVLQVVVTPLDHACEIRLRSGVDAQRRNLDRLPAYPDGTVIPAASRWDKWARSQHLEECRRDVGGAAQDASHVVSRTISSGIEIATAFALTTDTPTIERRSVQRHEYVGEELTFEGRQGVPVEVVKWVGFATTRDPDADPDSDVGQRAVATVHRHSSESFADTLDTQREAWAKLWDVSACAIVGDDRAALALNLGVYHLLIAANPDDATVNIGAKSLSGEGYRGHVFWDTEIMMLPFYLYTQPRAARALVGYRHHTLAGARDVAKENGTRGARYPWESADTGREECPKFTPDGKNRFHTREQEVHVSADVVYGIVEHARVTADESFLLNEGAEVLFETSRFWLDRAEADGDGLSVRTVMGPDEFHSFVDNNVFTNVLAGWALKQSVDLYHRLSRDRPDELAAISDRLGLSPDEPAAWALAAERLKRPHGDDPGLVEQFDGYLQRLDVPITEWDENDMPRYPQGYHHFNCEETQLLKQPDVVMLSFLFPQMWTLQTQKVNFDFYEARTLHKSSLSPSIHAIVGLQVGDSRMAERYFTRSAFVDLDDNQGNTDEGMHIASAGGTWQIAVHGFAGFRLVEDRLRFVPNLPASWHRLRFSIVRPDGVVRVDLGHGEHHFRLDAESGTTIELDVAGVSHHLTPEQPLVISATA